MNAGEKFINDGSADKAHSAAVMARKELKRAAALREYDKRLAGLEAAIATSNKAQRLRQTAYNEIDGVLKYVHLAQVLDWRL